MSGLLFYGDAGCSGFRPLLARSKCLGFHPPWGYIGLTLMEALFGSLGDR